jgi:hypothetical protein
LWVRLTHFFNFLFITLLIRSGIEIIGAHPSSTGAMMPCQAANGSA